MQECDLKVFRKEINVFACSDNLNCLQKQDKEKLKESKKEYLKSNNQMELNI